MGSITEGILVVDITGHVLMSNRAFERLFGLTGPTQGRLPVELVRNVEVQTAIEAVLSGSGARTQTMTTSGVPVRHFDVHVAPFLQDGEAIGVVAVFYDITELYQLERVRKDFVANASHEIRTPLTAIKGCADTLADGALNDAAAAERFVHTIVVHSKRLQLLLEDLLDLSRLESGKLVLDLEPVSIHQIVTRAAESVNQIADEKDISIDYEISTDLRVRCDAKHIEQAVVNLMDNAVKYTPEGGSVRVSVQDLEGEMDEVHQGTVLAPPDAGDSINDQPVHIGGTKRRDLPRVAVEISDTGLGIPSESLPRVFERFYRVDKSRSRQMGGTGLGLSIVRHIVGSHGERVYARSELAVGSTFGFTLPKA